MRGRDAKMFKKETDCSPYLIHPRSQIFSPIIPCFLELLV
jgi:hypothetical protein